MKSGDLVAVTENYRSKGVVGGWKPYTWYGHITTVRRATVIVKRQHSNFLSFRVVKKERIRVINELPETV